MEERPKTVREETATRGHERDAETRPELPAHRPVPGVKHKPEPDAENVMPAEHEPGTL